MMCSSARTESRLPDKRPVDIGPEAAKCGKRIVGHFTSWGKQNFTSKQATSLTHVIYAFLRLNGDGRITFGKVSDAGQTDAISDATSVARLTQLLQVARLHKHLKVQFAIGGWDNSDAFSILTADEQRRRVLINSIVQIIDVYKLDGVDIDWEYPVTGGAVEGTP
ncbi:Protein T13H5.3, partial [Aphelenchoides avenae]